MKRNEFHELFESVLRPLGVEFEFGRGRKHPHVLITLPNGGRKRLPFPQSTSDRRSLLNARRDLRRILREGGVVGV